MNEPPGAGNLAIGFEGRSRNVTVAIPAFLLSWISAPARRHAARASGEKDCAIAVDEAATTSPKNTKTKARAEP